MQVQQNNDPQCDPQLQKLLDEQLENLMKDTNNQNTDDQQYNYNSNVYFDKQLTHLVVTQQFCFKKISDILTEIFKNNKIDTSENACRLRWAYLHKNRQNLEDLKQKQKQQKRTISVAAFSNPYSLYSVDQLIENLQQAQKQKIDKNQTKQKVLQPEPRGYNIFKDSFRKIDNRQQYIQLQAKMKQALKKAQQNVYSESPLYFTPQYQKLQQFQVKSQELTAEKARQLMTYQIQMEKISRQLEVKKEQQEQQKYEKIIKQRMEQVKKMQKQKINGQIQEDWDEYESD